MRGMRVPCALIMSVAAGLTMSELASCTYTPAGTGSGFWRFAGTPMTPSMTLAAAVESEEPRVTSSTSRAQDCGAFLILEGSLNECRSISSSTVMSSGVLGGLPWAIPSLPVGVGFVRVQVERGLIWNCTCFSVMAPASTNASHTSSHTSGAAVLGLLMWRNCGHWRTRAKACSIVPSPWLSSWILRPVQGESDAIVVSGSTFSMLCMSWGSWISRKCLPTLRSGVFCLELCSMNSDDSHMLYVKCVFLEPWRRRTSCMSSASEFTPIASWFERSIVDHIASISVRRVTSSLCMSDPSSSLITMGSEWMQSCTGSDSVRSSTHKLDSLLRPPAAAKVRCRLSVKASQDGRLFLTRFGRCSKNMSEAMICLIASAQCSMIFSPSTSTIDSACACSAPPSPLFSTILTLLTQLSIPFMNRFSAMRTPPVGCSDRSASVKPSRLHHAFCRYT
mmetsp:Transcript_11666/g.27507  ORF Transcript_11666/g.27507 Transcript_11666/m.27507 type:complete len:449 (+) Transcript_11666:1693-3039(+)